MMRHSSGSPRGVHPGHLHGIHAVCLGHGWRTAGAQPTPNVVQITRCNRRWASFRGLCRIWITSIPSRLAPLLVTPGVLWYIADLSRIGFPATLFTTEKSVL
ncbi:uncharacterized protein BDR25DRAFT_112060 [Lindgomyces ingoldianus]|uniref:Uncharacterized protein n=1 Tax=Lindgomyces ingoldianus TaxID=673940 RepID=A0ACB6R6B3_9PLEO|nr:uncharacterized protein BDR25DRAFT_112060 [Lindgomyces ingoldianus]KAF2474789.1 hypothetical protein BDR25DRAFT_112060 [Lindgomyces ingoldianus]